MKFSIHSRTFATQLTRCHLFSIICDCRLKRLPQSYPSCPWILAIYCLEAGPTENTVSIIIDQQYLDCCLFVGAGTFLPSRCLAVDVYSGFPASCHYIHLSLFLNVLFPRILFLISSVLYCVPSFTFCLLTLFLFHTFPSRGVSSLFLQEFSQRTTWEFSIRF
jgi:hypothetical protein